MGMAVAHLRLEQENRQHPHEHAVAGVQLCKFHTIAFGTEGGHKPDEFI
ncbi:MULTISPECIES: hypothetical protein [Pseudomonas]|nr:MULTISPECIES: hypothetical protein [Pseudomonas]